MERRGFLSFLGLGVAGAMLPDSLKIMPHLFKVENVSTDLDPVNIKSITEAVSLEFEQVYKKLMGNTFAIRSVPPTRIGDIIGSSDGRRTKDVVFDNQCHVYFNPPENAEGMHERYVVPAAHVLARECARAQMNVFGTLNAMPLGLTSGTRSGGDVSGCVVNTGKTAIRGILHSYYDIGWDQVMTTLRFDAIGGHA